MSSTGATRRTNEQVSVGRGSRVLKVLYSGKVLLVFSHFSPFLIMHFCFIVVKVILKVPGSPVLIVCCIISSHFPS